MAMFNSYAKLPVCIYTDLYRCCFVVVPPANLRCQAHHSRRKGPWLVAHLPLPWASGCGRSFLKGLSNLETSSFHQSWARIISHHLHQPSLVRVGIAGLDIGLKLLWQSALAFSPAWMIYLDHQQISAVGHSWDFNVHLRTDRKSAEGTFKVHPKFCIFCIHCVYTLYLYHIYN